MCLGLAGPSFFPGPLWQGANRTDFGAASSTIFSVPQLPPVSHPLLDRGASGGHRSGRVRHDGCDLGVMTGWVAGGVVLRWITVGPADQPGTSVLHPAGRRRACGHGGVDPARAARAQSSSKGPRIGLPDLSGLRRGRQVAPRSSSRQASWVIGVVTHLQAERLCSGVRSPTTTLATA